MSYFLKNGNQWQVSSKEALDLHELLPAANYAVKFNVMNNTFYLDLVDSFVLPTKIYGTVSRDATRILKTFVDRRQSTGVLLTGEKGSGKTLLAKLLSIQAASWHTIPTLIVNTSFTGEAFNTFIQGIDQPCVIMFDEFEKVYDGEEQNQILTLLDGVMSSNKLFVLTCNDKWRINSHMRNRPGRIFYLLDFTGLDENFVRAYCKDQLHDQSRTDAVCRVNSMFSKMNFDMLQALVEEMNRYNESPAETLRMLNMRPEFSEDTEYQIISLTARRSPIVLVKDTWRGNPLSIDERIHIDYKYQETNFDSDPFDFSSDCQRSPNPSPDLEPVWQTAVCQTGGGLTNSSQSKNEMSMAYDSANFIADDMSKYDPVTGTFVFKNSQGEVLEIKYSNTTHEIYQKMLRTL